MRMDVLSKQTSEAKNFQSHMRTHSFVHTHIILMQCSLGGVAEFFFAA